MRRWFGACRGGGEGPDTASAVSASGEPPRIAPWPSYGRQFGSEPLAVPPWAGTMDTVGTYMQKGSIAGCWRGESVEAEGENKRRTAHLDAGQALAKFYISVIPID